MMQRHLERTGLTAKNQPTAHDAFFSFSKGPDGNSYVNLYGADDYLLNGMEATEGTIDLAKLKTGKYILLSVAIPALLYRQIAKAGIIERLRQN